MSSELYVSASGASARMRDLEIVANNLANAETVGFRRDRTLFEAALESQIGDRVPGAPGRAYVALAGLAADFTAGPVKRTGAPLDVALTGRGLFEVDTPAGPAYTRAGSFVVDSGGYLAMPEGHRVMGSGGPIQVGASRAHIDASGQVVDPAGRPLGRLAVVDFERPEQLVKQGDNLFRESGDAGLREVRSPELAAASLESSNVVATRALAQLVVLQRAFEASMQTLTRQDQATDRLLREVGS